MPPTADIPAAVTMRSFSGLILSMFLSPCTMADTFVREDIIVAPTPAAFSVCYGNSCAEVAQLELEPVQWQKVRALFLPPPADAAQERARIAQAIGLLESVIGNMTHTGNDRGGTFFGLSAGGIQMDCIDESINSTTYLRMLSADGLLTWHQVKDRATRGFFLFGWPHTTAVVRDRGTGDDYAVDSWFHHNGVPPAVVPLAIWRDGWKPPDQGL